MRSRLSNIVGIALTALLLQGCDLSPTAPSSEPATNQAGLASAASPGSGAGVKAGFSYTVDHFGDVTGSAGAVGGTKKNDTAILADPITLNLTFFKNQTGWETCFDAVWFTGSEQINERSSGAQATDFVLFFFDAKGKDGTPGIHYSLHMLGDISGTWPPEPGQEGTFTAGNNPVGPQWEISARGKDRRLACAGSGSFGQQTGIVVTRN